MRKVFYLEDSEYGKFKLIVDRGYQIEGENIDSGWYSKGSRFVKSVDENEQPVEIITVEEEMEPLVNELEKTLEWVPLFLLEDDIIDGLKRQRNKRLKDYLLGTLNNRELRYEIRKNILDRVVQKIIHQLLWEYGIGGAEMPGEKEMIDSLAEYFSTNPKIDCIQTELTYKNRTCPSVR